MKTLEDIKNEYANECGRDSWDDYFKLMELCHYPLSFVQLVNDTIAKRFAIEVAKQSLENASENVKLITDYEYGESVQSVCLDSITNQDNIPKI